MRSLHNAPYAKFLVVVRLTFYCVVLATVDAFGVVPLVLCVALATTACASPLAQARVAVVASRDMLKLECPRYLTVLYPERVSRCETRLAAQNVAEAAYDGALAAHALGNTTTRDKLLAKLTGLVTGLLE